MDNVKPLALWQRIVDHHVADGQADGSDSPENGGKPWKMRTLRKTVRNGVVSTQTSSPGRMVMDRFFIVCSSCMCDTLRNLISSDGYRQDAVVRPPLSTQRLST